jgi:peptide/nickel transport system substrate-binding protein
MMVNHLLGNTKPIALPLLLLILLFSIACGAVASPTPFVVEKNVGKEAAKEMPKEAAKEMPKEAGVQPTRLFVATVVPTPTISAQAPVGEVVQDRVVFVTDVPTKQSTMDCEVTGSATFQHRPSSEYLIDPNRYSGVIEPMLAAEWSMSSDARTWNFKLRKGVKWHFGFGEFTAHDVLNELNYYTNPDCKASYWDYLRRNPDADVEVVNDYEINFHMQARPAVGFDYWISGYRGLPFGSKAQWDAGCPNAPQGYEEGYCRAGEDGVRAKPARTGPYQFVNFEKGVSWLYERVPYEHYRTNPDFKELEIRLVKEPATRLAIMLAREGHIGAINRSLLQEALDGGLEIANSSVTGVIADMAFGGLYYASSLTDKFDPNVPWAVPGENGKKVRMAMNKALDRDLINEAIFDGQGEPQRIARISPAFPGGYNPKWEDSWEELYGYDPNRAKELLAEAGYANGFELPIKVFTLSGIPEMPEFLEAAAGMWEAIGLQPKLEEIEFSRWREKYRGADTNCCVYPWRSYAAPPHPQVFGGYSPERFMRFYVSDSITEARDKALNSTRFEDQIQYWQQISDEVFYEVATLPLFALPVQAVIDPEVVAEYAFLGPYGGQYTALEYVKGARR